MGFFSFALRALSITCCGLTSNSTLTHLWATPDTHVWAKKNVLVKFVSFVTRLVDESGILVCNSDVWREPVDAAGFFTIETSWNNTLLQRSVRVDSGDCSNTLVLSQFVNVVVPPGNVPVEHDLRHIFSCPKSNTGSCPSTFHDLGDTHWRINPSLCVLSERACHGCRWLR